MAIPGSLPLFLIDCRRLSPVAEPAQLRGACGADAVMNLARYFSDIGKYVPHQDCFLYDCDSRVCSAAFVHSFHLSTPGIKTLSKPVCRSSTCCGFLAEL